MPVTVPADRRFLRAGHVRPVRRRGWLRTTFRLVRVVVAMVALGYAGYLAVHFVRSSPMLRIDHVVVHGNTKLSTGEVLALVDGMRGQNVLTADLTAWRRALLDSSWVKDAVLRRVLPGTIEVVVSERRPMAIARLRAGLFLVDEDGTVIDEFGPKYAEFDLPIVDGLDAAGGQAQGQIDSSRVALAARLFDALRGRPDLVKRISQVDVTNPHDAVVMLDRDPALVRLGDTDFVERLQSYLELSPALRERVPEMDYVDLRFGERLYVGPAGSHAAPKPGTKARKF